ncbi:glycosyltransferase family 2 protein [Flexibacterium corallicola]|uniref:glycosyltransferase family 2 protein n=1 Tax=Flexibacterium corallicola TaxID=3037259 RepID=UPI00286F2483|nr:glycosyltransferase family 2 protein [Pseudovibrio sp. M1P-2-3]
MLKEDIKTDVSRLSTPWKVSYSPIRSDQKSTNAHFVSQHDTDNSIHLDLSEEVKWLRLEYEIDESLLAKGALEFHFEYRALAPAAGNGPSLKILEYKSGIGKTFCKVCASIARSGKARKLSKHIELPHPPAAEAEYRLAFEFQRPVKFWLDSFNIESNINPIIPSTEVEETDYTGNIPYRNLNYQVSETLRSLNDDMDAQLRKDPSAWVGKMIRVALLLEDYETAQGLSKYFLQSFGTNAAALKLFQNYLLRSYVGTGSFQEALDLIRYLAMYTELSEETFQLARILEPPEPELHKSDYILPSGKADIFNLSRSLEKKKLISFREMLEATPKNYNAFLLWANYYLDIKEDSYIRYINCFFESFKCPYQLCFGSYSENVLKRITFSPIKPIEQRKDGPLVSIIIATYNAESTIDYAIKSIINQNYSNYEILICDDCSTDATQGIISNYKDLPNVRVFASDVNQGPYNIRNEMIKNAVGDFITFHDADDMALPHRITSQVSKMIEQQAEVSLASWVRIKRNGYLVAFKDGAYLRDCLNSIMFSREVFEEHGPYREVLCGADSEFYEKLRGALHPDQIVKLKEPLVLGLWGDSSLTRTSGIEADEIGFRAKARREYSAIAGRQRILGSEIIPEEKVIEAIKSANIYREHQLITEVI